VPLSQVFVKVGSKFWLIMQMRDRGDCPEPIDWLTQPILGPVGAFLFDFGTAHMGSERFLPIWVLYKTFYRQIDN